MGIANSKMIGYWDDKPVVSTSNNVVLATEYLKNKKMLFSVASWAKEEVNITLNIEFRRAGHNPDRIQITAPAIDRFQPERTFAKTRLYQLNQKKWIAFDCGRKMNLSAASGQGILVDNLFCISAQAKGEFNP